MHKLN